MLKIFLGQNFRILVPGSFNIIEDSKIYRSAPRNIFQQKLEMVKSNADNSQEMSYYQGFEREGYLR